MSINIGMPGLQELKPKITVIGVGGAGGNAVNNMIRSSLEGVDFVVGNTDAQALSSSLADHKVQLGSNITQGLGAGSRPEVGRAAAEEAIEVIRESLIGSNMVFIAAGMGGGTGTGAGPVVAQLARQEGILTVGVVTKPFQFEGAHRMAVAEAGVEEMQQYVDTLIVIPNQNLFRVANEKTTFADAFNMADDVLHSGVRGVTDLMVMPGLINLDFADVRAVMSEMGKAMMGTGEASGENRASQAAEAAIANPLLDDVSLKGARGVLINITGGSDLTLFEVDEAANRIRNEVDGDANIIVGATFDQELDGEMRVSVVATGIESDEAAMPRPVELPSLVAIAGHQTAAEEISVAEPEPEPELAAAPEIQPEVQTPIEPEPEYGQDSPVQSQPAVAEVVLEPEPQQVSQPAQKPDAQIAAEFIEKPFIPPAPAQPAARERAPLPAPEPFAEAALANGGGKEAPRKPGFFDRMKGRGRAAIATPSAREASVEQQVEPKITQAVAGRIAEPSLTVTPSAAGTPAAVSNMSVGTAAAVSNMPAGTAAEVSGTTAPQTIAPLVATGDNNSTAQEPLDQCSLAGATVDVVSKPLAPTPIEEEQLEIPAFLRRQAN